jgi:hypothetical protein
MDNTTANIFRGENISYVNYDLNSLLTEDYLYVTVSIVLLLVCGIIGNSIVIKIYYFNIKVDPLSGRAFIPALACMDLLACIAGSLIYLVQNLQAAAFSGDAMCKFYYVLAYSCTMGASLMLVLISVHRHRKVCSPFKRQFPLIAVKLSPFITGATGLILTLPMIPVVGEYRYFHTFYKKYGQKCTVLYETDLEVYFWIYFVIIASIFFTTCVVISVLSYLIHKTIQRQIKFRRSSISTANRSETSFSPVPCPEESGSLTDPQSSRNQRSVRQNSHETTNGTLQKKSRPKREKREYAIMFLAISIIYVVTWLPTLVVNGVKVLLNGVEETSTPVQYTILRYLNSLFTLNNIVNPIIYFKFDKDFRRRLQAMFQCEEE